MEEETLSSDPTDQSQIPPPNSPLMPSTTSAFVLGPNDDQLERAQARAARAAAVRFKPGNTFQPQNPDAGPDHYLNKQQILDLFHNCIKLLNENKINQKNTWDLNFIDHLTDITRAGEGDDNGETNFQMASYTLEAGVKIYSLRVDSLHSMAYRVLGGMLRAGKEAEQDNMQDSVNAKSGKKEIKKVMDKKFSPLSTLESSFEALNVKKFDAAFAVDPLYRQTSALFDEGGARGLLTNNLGVYGGCRVLFDSLEVPGKCMAGQSGHDISDTIDLSFAGDCVEQIVSSMHTKDGISPTLRVVVNQFDENNRRSSDFQFSGENSAEEFDAAIDCEIGAEREECENFQQWSDDHDDRTFVADLGSNDADPSVPTYPQEEDLFPSLDPDDISENVDDYLFFSLGFGSKKNAWAGPDHWKYRKSKGSEVLCTSEDGLTPKPPQPRTKRQVEVELDFTSFLEKPTADIFVRPKNPKSLLLPKNRRPCNTKLPEDCHYNPEDLVKLFLLPNVKCLGKSMRKPSVVPDGSREQCNDYESFPSWDNGSVCDEESHDEVPSYVDDSSVLISQPRQVNKVEVRYDKTSKQVDVQALKTTLWDHIQESAQFALEGKKETVSFRDILAKFPSECNAAATVSDISPHLCFICLLHLANEKGLSIESSPNLDDLAIHLSDVCAAESEVD